MSDNTTETILLQFKTNAEQITQQMVDLTASMNRYNEAAKAVQKEQEEVNKQYKEGKISMEDYDKKMAVLNKDLDDMRAGAQQAQAQIKTLNASSLSNLWDGFKKGISSSKSLTDVVKVTRAAFSGFFKMLMANPWVAIATVIATVVVKAFQALSDAFKKNDDAGTAFSRVMSILQTPMKILQKLVAKLAEWLGKLMNAFADFVTEVAKYVPIIGDVIRANDDLIQQEDELEDKRRQHAKNQAKLNREIEELREKATDADEYSAEQRKKFLQEVQEKETEYYNNEKKLTEEEIDLIKKRAKVENDTSDETKDKITELEAKRDEADANLAKSTRRNSRQMRSITREAQSAAAAQAKAAKDAEQARIKANEEMYRRIKQINQAILELEIEAGNDSLENQIKLEQIKRNQRIEALRKEKEDVQKQMEEFQKMNKKYTQEELDEQQRKIDEANAKRGTASITKAQGQRLEELKKEEEALNQMKDLMDKSRAAIKKLDAEYLVKYNNLEERAKKAFEQYGKYYDGITSYYELYIKKLPSNIFGSKEEQEALKEAHAIYTEGQKIDNLATQIEKEVGRHNSFYGETNKSLMRINRQRKEINDQVTQTNAAYEAAYQKEVSLLAKMNAVNKEYAQTEEDRIKGVITALDAQIEAEQKAANAAKDRITKEYTDINPIRRQIWEERIEMLNNYYDKEEEKIYLAYDEEMEALEAKYHAEQKTTKEYEELKLAILTRYQQKQAELNKKYDQDVLALAQAARTLELERMEDSREKAILLEADQYNAEIQNLKDSTDAKLQTTDEFHRLLEQKELEHKQRIAEINKEWNEKQRQEDLANIQSFANASSSLMSNTAGVFGEIAKSYQDEFERITKGKEQLSEVEKRQAVAALNRQKSAVVAQTAMNLTSSISSAIAAAASAASAGGPAAPIVYASVLAGLLGSIYAQINSAKQSMSGIEDQIQAIRETPTRFATGGYIEGPGTAKSDSIPARLSNGESVINAKSTSMYYDLLSAINQKGGGAPFPNSNPNFRFADGGVVQHTESIYEAVRVAMSEYQPVVSVKEITRVQSKIKVKENQ